MQPPSKWADFTRVTAQKSYLYAQMASNTYGKAGDMYGMNDKQYKLPASYKAEHHGNSDNGMAYSIFRKYENDKLTEIVISFRGTEGIFDFKDMIYGNILGLQNKEAIEVYKAIKSEVSKIGSDIPIILVGHSLGGALAIHVAINTGNLKVFAYNTSPRFWIEEELEGNNDIESIVEAGEFLKVFRIPGNEATQTYTSISCQQFKDPFTQHSMSKLAYCLTQIASIDLPEKAVVKWND